MVEETKHPEFEARTVNVSWREASARGFVRVIDGDLARVELLAGNGSVCGETFTFAGGPGALRVAVRNGKCGHEKKLTVVQVRSDANPVTFLLRDALRGEHPVIVPEWGVAAVPGDDTRTYAEIAADVAAKKSVSDFQRFIMEPEETFEDAAARHRKRFCPTFLGIARDMRTFRFHLNAHDNWGSIISTYAANAPRVRDVTKDGDFCLVSFQCGHHSSSLDNSERRLHDGALPILHVTQKEGRLEYRMTLFATLESAPLGSARVAGTGNEWSYACATGSMIPADERERIRRQANSTLYENEEQVVLWGRIGVVNTGGEPAYGWLKAPILGKHRANTNTWDSNDFTYDADSGFAMDRDRVVAVSLIDGAPVPQQRYPFLVTPGRAVNIDLLIPHAPIPVDRARKLSASSYQDHFRAACAHWQAKLDEDKAAIRVPEQRITEMLRAGLLHCDLISFGTEPDGPLGVSVGTFGPIGSESAPIIEFFDCMGRHRFAERALEYFFNEQREDGFVQGFANYESETGPVLALAGRHLRYSGNAEWIARMAPKMKKGCRYMIEWRNRSKTDECRKTGGYGLIRGKVADANLFFHDCSLNAWTYLGLKHCADALADIDPTFSRELRDELSDYRDDILAAVRETMGRSPLVPTGDGTWAPLQTPWLDYDEDGMTNYGYGSGDDPLWRFSHGFIVLHGPTYLVFAGLLEPDSDMCALILKANQYPCTIENSAMFQPYINRHGFAHLRRGEVKAFLKTYYNQLTAIADPETYTFWEALYDQSSPHKTHEEAWFLMQTRWMLYLEDGDALRLLSAVPRRWLEHGQVIELRQVVSLFGRLSLRVESHLDNNVIKACVECEPERAPKTVFVRLPHPDNLPGRTVTGGEYDPETETVKIPDFTGTAEVTLRFGP